MKVCKTCGKTFSRPKGVAKKQWATRTYCSRECTYKARKSPPCSVCGDPKVVGRGWCSLHYGRWKHHGDPLYEPKEWPTECSVDGCDKKVTARGFCATHYSRFKKHGNPHTVLRRGGIGKPPVVFPGERYGDLTVVEQQGSHPKGGRLYRCKCDCGGDSVVLAEHLQNGNTKSCGCKAACQITHGLGPNPQVAGSTYISWCSMKARCTKNPKARHYKWYGSRGITVTPRWLGRDGFKHFLEDMGERPEGKTLDRIDVDGNYEPSNCRWATAKEQANNKQANARLAELKELRKVVVQQDKIIQTLRQELGV